MKKLLLITATLSMMTSGVMAQNIYVGVGAGIEMVEDLDNGVHGELSVGTVFPNNFGIEGKLTKSISKPEDTQGSDSITADIFTASVFATYSHRLSPELTLMPKVGFSSYSTDIELKIGGATGSDDDSNVNVAFGLDVKYDMNPETSLYVGYTVFKPEFNNNKFDSSHVSFGVQQKF